MLLSPQVGSSSTRAQSGCRRRRHRQTRPRRPGLPSGRRRPARSARCCSHSDHAWPRVPGRTPRPRSPPRRACLIGSPDGIDAPPQPGECGTAEIRIGPVGAPLGDHHEIALPCPALASQQTQPDPDLVGRAYPASSTRPATQEHDRLLGRGRGAKDHYGQMNEPGFGLRPVLGNDQLATVDLSMRGHAKPAAHVGKTRLVLERPCRGSERWGDSLGNDACPRGVRIGSVSLPRGGRGRTGGNGADEDRGKTDQARARGRNERHPPIRHAHPPEPALQNASSKRTKCSRVGCVAP
jgi:hypothetical protein